MVGCVSQAPVPAFRRALLGVVLMLGILTATEGRKLKFVNLIYRHGDRSPMNGYPTDPITEKDWPQGYGQLTQVGMRQHYELGQYLRRRYKDFLNISYDRHEIYVRSTDIDRTLMSAESDLAGLYPPHGQQIFHSDLKWQPIPVHTVPVKDDKFLKFPIPNCPRYDKLLEESMNSKTIQDKVKESQAFLDMISEKTKLKVTFQNVWKLYDTMLCEKIHNFSMPSWVTPKVMAQLRELNNLGMEALFRIHETRVKSRLQGGMLLKQILQNIAQVINGTNSTHKLIMYSAHDTTLIALQMALSIYNNIIPPYASCHMFELYQEDDGSFTLDMYFKNDTGSEVHLLALPSCTQHCPLQSFIQNTRDLIPENRDEECKLSRESNQREVILIAAFCVCLVLIILLLIALCYCWNRKTEHHRIPANIDELA